ncbi:MAG: sulfite exporter TauE/SafE family protein [Thermodesulfobacteriota bacterium]
MFEFVAPFFIGFVGSVHCLGMCGPLVLAYSLHIKSHEGEKMIHVSSPWEKGLFHHIAFHSGRILSYGFLGILSAGLLERIDFIEFQGNLRGGVTLLGGAFMILLGFVLLKVLPLPGFFTLLWAGLTSFWKPLLPPLFQSQRLGSKIMLGLASGFLPCCLSWAMIVKSATTENLGAGFLTMVSFGLGTVPALFLIGFSASFLSLRARFLGERVAALSVIVMGLILISKGARIVA